MDQPPTQVVEIACNLDDASGEIVGGVIEDLLSAGALDAWATPITMKKQRPGVTLSVLCEQGLREMMTRLMIELTGSFGVRYRDWGRLVLDRRHEPVRISVDLDQPLIGWVLRDVPHRRDRILEQGVGEASAAAPIAVQTKEVGSARPPARIRGAASTKERPSSARMRSRSSASSAICSCSRLFSSTSSSGSK